MNTETRKIDSLPKDTIGYIVSDTEIIYLDMESAQDYSNGSTVTRVVIPEGTPVMIKNHYEDDGAPLFSTIEITDPRMTHG